MIIGFMGTGKTAVGMKLAEKLEYRFVDTDRWIEKEMSKTIPEIFGQEGEPYFRDLEERVVQEASGLTGAVISTGGGVVVRPENIRRLKAGAFMVSLKATPEVIYERIRKEGPRPLLQAEDPLDAIRQLLRTREESYSRADLILDTSTLDVDRVVEKIIDGYKRHRQEGS